MLELLNMAFKMTKQCEAQIARHVLVSNKDDIVNNSQRFPIKARIDNIWEVLLFPIFSKWRLPSYGLFGGI